MEKTSENKVVPIEIDLEGMHYKGEAVAIDGKTGNMPNKFSVALNKKIYFHLECVDTVWKSVEPEVVSQEFVDAIGEYVFEYYN